MMQQINEAQFTNAKGDKVAILLFQDSQGIFHLIVKEKRVRTEIEKRFHKMNIVEMSVMTHTNEVAVLEIPLERTAIVEFNMRRALLGDPDYTMAEFQSWLSATDKEES